MCDDKQFKEESGFIDRLENFLSFPDDEEDIGPIRKRLIAEGLDPDGTVARVRALLGQTERKDAALSWKDRAKALNTRMNEELKRIAAGVQGTREEWLTRLEVAFSQKKAQAFFRNLRAGEMTDEEIANLIARLEILEASENDAEENSHDFPLE